MGEEEGSHGTPAGKHAPCSNVLFVLLILSTFKNVSLFPLYILSICPTEYLSNSPIRREIVSFRVQECAALWLKKKKPEQYIFRHWKVGTFTVPKGNSRDAIKPECNFHLGGRRNKHEYTVNDLIYWANFPKGRINPYVHYRCCHCSVTNQFRKKRNINFTNYYFFLSWLYAGWSEKCTCYFTRLCWYNIVSLIIQYKLTTATLTWTYLYHNYIHRLLVLLKIPNGNSVLNHFTVDVMTASPQCNNHVSMKTICNPLCHILFVLFIRVHNPALENTIQLAGCGW